MTTSATTAEDGARPDGPTHFVSALTVLPTGATLHGPDWDNTRHFMLTVKWRGPRTETGRGGYAVTDGHHDLSRAHNWGYPERYQQHQYRWETLEEALAAALAVVDTYKVNGRTWAQWQEHFATRQEAV